MNASILRTKESEEFYQWDNSFKGKASQYLQYLFFKGGLKLKKKYSWNNVWSAGQSVGEVENIMTCKEIITKMIKEYEEAIRCQALNLDSMR